MKDEMFILCNYKKGMLMFSERNEKYDGEYVFVVNAPGDFSLYNTEAFNKFQEKLVEMSAKSNDKRISVMARYIFSRAEIINVVKGGFKVPSHFMSGIDSEVFEARIFCDHIRYISSDIKLKCELQKDVVEKMDEDIFS